MTRSLLLPLLMAALAATPASALVTFDWAYVGNAGNAPDPQTGFGAVAYDYAIAKHEVTNAQYVEFLNAVDPTGANILGLFNSQNFDDGIPGNLGIELQAFNAAGNKFVLKVGRAQNPVTYVSFTDVMRFTNWLHNGQGSGDTETGAYTIGSGEDQVRSASAKHWVPSENEWYKAAYHNASAGMAGIYFDFATGSDSVPVSDQPGDNPAAVNYYNDDDLPNGFNDGHATSGSKSYPYADVGAYRGAASPYGTFDQNGNVWEWNESVTFPSTRGVRGGSWLNTYTTLRGLYRYSTTPSFENHSVGFRMATVVPEPSALLMVSLLTAGLLAPRRA